MFVCAPSPPRSIAVHDVSTGRLLASAQGDSNRILGVAWPLPGSIATAGISHLKFWSSDLKPDLVGVFVSLFRCMFVCVCAWLYTCACSLS